MWPASSKEPERPEGRWAPHRLILAAKKTAIGAHLERFCINRMIVSARIPRRYRDRAWCRRLSERGRQHAYDSPIGRAGEEPASCAAAPSRFVSSCAELHRSSAAVLPRRATWHHDGSAPTAGSAVCWPQASRIGMTRSRLRRHLALHHQPTRSRGPCAYRGLRMRNEMSTELRFCIDSPVIALAQMTKPAEYVPFMLPPQVLKVVRGTGHSVLCDSLHLQLSIFASSTISPDLANRPGAKCPRLMSAGPAWHGAESTGPLHTRHLRALRSAIESRGARRGPRLCPLPRHGS